MSKIRKFTQFSLRDLVAAAGPTILVIVALCALAYVLVDPTPPRHVTLGTGQENSAYEELGKRYAAALAKQGIKVTMVRSLGSQENLQRLNEGKVDIAFVQSGSTDQAEAQRAGLMSLGSLFTEPVWLFLREGVKVDKLTDLKGLKINLGPEGTGVPKLFRQVLDLNGIAPADLTIG
ncbi:MAG: TAXI family TRAP transporter solute-binding subunit, partial [Massilia sp.]